MALRTRPVYGWQFQLVCVFTIFGMRFEDACKSINVPERVMRKLMPPLWYDRRASRRYTAEDWRRVQEAYETGNEPVEALQRRFRISPQQLYAAITRGNWKRRMARLPVSVRSMTPHQRYLYSMLRYDAKLPREKALAEALA